MKQGSNDTTELDKGELPASAPVIRLVHDPEKILRIKASKSLNQAREKWNRMNREYPANLDDHLGMERLIAGTSGIIQSFFVEGALIIAADPDWCTLEDCRYFLEFFKRGFHLRYRIIVQFTTTHLTIRDGEELLESFEQSDRVFGEETAEDCPDHDKHT